MVFIHSFITLGSDQSVPRRVETTYRKLANFHIFERQLSTPPPTRSMNLQTTYRMWETGQKEEEGCCIERAT